MGNDRGHRVIRFMSPNHLFRLLAAAPCALALTGGHASANDTRQTVRPREDESVVLHNPDMGWVLYENAAIDGSPHGTGTMTTIPNAHFDGCDVVAIMFSWADVEREEGRYDWSRVDAAWGHWQKLGKEIHMRISTEPLFIFSTSKPPTGMGIPDWLLARIPDAKKQRRPDDAERAAGDQSYGWHVDARNPLYRERLEAFLREANAHFTGDRKPTLVDLRGFGKWGEWHTGYRYKSLDEKREALAGVLDIWSRSFPDRMLAISYSHDPDGPPDLYAGSNRDFQESATTTYDDYLRYSGFDLALEKPNITLRRDGCGGAVFSNHRKLCEHAYRDLKRAPQASEFLGGYADVRRGGEAYLKWFVDDGLSLHPNYMNLIGYSSRDAHAFLVERPDLIGHGLRRMGYRLVPLEVTLPKAVRAGEPVSFKMKWINRAVGRAVRDYTLRVRLVHNTHHMLATADAGALPTSQWLEGDEHSITATATFPTITVTGKAMLQLSLFDPATGRPVALPLTDRHSGEFCDIAEVEVLAP
jgi:hypothetical protein